MALQLVIQTDIKLFFSIANSHFKVNNFDDF